MKKNPYSINRVLKEIFFNFAFTLLLFLWVCDLKVEAKTDSCTEFSPDSIKGLKDYYKDFFPIGVSVSPNSLQGSQSFLILKHFQSLTAENVMKPALIHPEENIYFWDDADKIADYASLNKMMVRSHTLSGHKQTAEWMFKDSEGKTVSKDILLARLKDHIMQVVKRYKGRIYEWDVVNEAIDDDDSKYMRESDWFKICGEEYIEKAFRWAHEADPDALLFYNDYNTESR